VKRNFSLTRFITIRSDVAYSEIANFENYINFVPGCSSAELIEKNDNYEIGKLNFDFMIRNYSIKSKNILSDNFIEIEQIEGPFEFFKGKWMITECGLESSEINFYAEFKLPFLLNNLLPDQVINTFCESAIKAFVRKLNKKN